MKVTDVLKNTNCNILDAEVLLAHVLQKNRSYLRAHDRDELDSFQQEQFDALIERRKNGEPVAYLTGHCEFWSLDFLVTNDVLIPRPETELLVETVLEIFPKTKKITIADLGTGSGVIALALASECPCWEIIATDFSQSALNIAKKNAQRLSIDNVTFIQSDWCLQLPQKKYDIIISNPPYIAENDPHLLALQYEPKSALVAENEGLAAFERIMQQAKHYLNDGGLLLFEHGYQQAEAIHKLFKQFLYKDINTKQDLAGLPRVTYALA